MPACVPACIYAHAHLRRAKDARLGTRPHGSGREAYQTGERVRPSLALKRSRAGRSGGSRAGGAGAWARAGGGGSGGASLSLSPNTEVKTSSIPHT